MEKSYKNLKLYNHLSDNGRDPEKFWLLMSFFLGFTIGTMVTVGVIL